LATKKKAPARKKASAKKKAPAKKKASAKKKAPAKKRAPAKKKGSVDLLNSRRVLVIHGVQIGEDAQQNQHLSIRDLVDDLHPDLKGTYEVDMFRYEDMNDKSAYGKVAKLLGLFGKIEKGFMFASGTIDMIGDVLIALDDDSSVGAKVRQALEEKILESYDDERPLIVVAHSLGTLYAFDVINKLIDKDNFFIRDDKKTWPVQAFVTLGSPLGLSWFKRTKVSKMGPGNEYFPWYNFWDPSDPVISSSLYGRSVDTYIIEDRFKSHDKPSGWAIQDIPVDIGMPHLLAHVGYWNHKPVGNMIANLL